MKISVIVPVYNTSAYLKRCIESILNQTIGFENIELILVNDGSTDNSENIIKEYTSKYKNIKYIYQENNGQASARNTGLKQAKGEYISFIDSDDWIEPDMYEKLYHNKYDIISCDYTCYYGDEEKYVSFRYCDEDRKNFIIMNTGPCNLIIKRDLLNIIKFEFPKGIIYEDLAVIPLLGIVANKIKYIEKSYYNYFIRDNSTMKQTNYSRKLEDIFESINILYNKWLEIDKSKKYLSEIEYLFIRRLLMSATLRFMEHNDPNKCIDKIALIMKEKFPNWSRNEYYKKLPFKQKIVAKLAYKKRKMILKVLLFLNNKTK